MELKYGAPANYHDGMFVKIKSFFSDMIFLQFTNGIGIKVMNIALKPDLPDFDRNKKALLHAQ